MSDILSSVSPSSAQEAFARAERAAAHIPGLTAGPEREIASVAVVGAGTMGSGIAIALLQSGLPVTLIETAQPALERGTGTIRAALERMVARGRLSRAAAEGAFGRLDTSLDMAAAGDADLVIEAVYESMELKQAIFARLDGIARTGAILASNTSFLDIDEIAAATNRPEAVLGLHFFSPANVMRLLEIVRGRRTAPEVLAAALAFARRIGKVGVVSGVCDGFIANRLMRPRALQADAMALEGTPIAETDRVLTDYGFPMGHFQMMDLAGLDIVTRGRTDRTVMGDLVAAGRLGQKSGAGYYDYDGRRAVPSQAVDATIAAVARDLGVDRRPTAGDDAILDRLLLPVVNEGARIIAEGVALRASDVDLAAILGYGWPLDRGGPLFWADGMGLATVVEKLRGLEERLGAQFAPCEALVQAVGTRAFAY
ncbi:3-hydroxyacyl-CoA dehydrogenase [Flavisphingomonas formosensis]|uniref:3-hydroxyacyl-CoA dehydrogenase n=1 Tax=Flavisphingomonas formosensis TaxID=861534 RepID=UPI0012FCE70E|nr:3-hydroxyacyl-CoA dehydrogenase [Sphingomonas formosensis]